MQRCSFLRKNHNFKPENNVCHTDFLVCFHFFQQFLSMGTIILCISAGQSIRMSTTTRNKLHDDMQTNAAPPCRRF